MAHELRGASAVVGVGLTKFGDLPGKVPLEVAAEAVHNALGDAGLKKSDVDGFFTSGMNHVFHGVQAAEYLGIQPNVIDSTNIGGSSFVNCVQSAAMALKTGVCEVALIAYGSTARSNPRGGHGGGGGPNAYSPHESEYKPRNPIVSYALSAARHMHEYGTTREQLAAVAVAARDWARKNPRAEMRDPLTIEDVLSSRMVCDPFTVRDCCLVSDAGAAAIMVSADRAKDFPHKPAYLLGIGSAVTHDQIAQMPDLTVSPASQSGPPRLRDGRRGGRAISMSSSSTMPSPSTRSCSSKISAFAPRARGGRFVADGHIGPGGSHPVNTNGGGLSCVHPGMYGMFVLIEAVEQLRGECGDRQIDSANLALANGNGGRLASQVTAIFGTDATL